MKRGRGRPRQYDPEEALQAAMEMFWEQGFSATTLTDVCGATGMNRPSLYAAFGDKHAVFERALERYADHMSTQLGPPLMAEPDLEQALGGFYRGALAIYTSGPEPRGCMMFAVASVDAATDPRVREALSAVLARLDEVMAARFQQAVRVGQLAAGDAPARARLAVALLHSLSVRARSGTPLSDLEAMVDQSLPLLTRSGQEHG